MNLFFLCLKIFCARIIDVSMGTIRTVYIVKEKRLIATLIAFFEVLIWFEIARESLNTEITSIFIPISYAAGYAMGTFIGTFLSSRFVKGHLTLNIISNKIKEKDISFLKEQGYGISTINVDNDKKMLIMEVDKKNLRHLQDLILSIDKKAFIIINETKYVHNGYLK